MFEQSLPDQTRPLIIIVIMTHKIPHSRPTLTKTVTRVQTRPVSIQPLLHAHCENILLVVIPNIGQDVVAIPIVIGDEVVILGLRERSLLTGDKMGKGGRIRRPISTRGTSIYWSVRVGHLSNRTRQSTVKILTQPTKLYRWDVIQMGKQLAMAKRRTRGMWGEQMEMEKREDFSQFSSK